MDPKIEATKPRPIRLIKALLGCMVLFVIPGLYVTFVSPSFTIHLTRINQEYVDATVIKYLIFIVPVSKYTATEIIGTESKIIDGGLIRDGSTSNRTGKVTGEAEDEGLLLLKAAQNKLIEVYISPQNIDNVADEIQYFITESKESSLRLWVTSNWKFGVILPGGILLFGLVAFLSTAWAIITGQPLRRDSARTKKV